MSNVFSTCPALETITITDLDITFIGEHEGQDVMSQSQIPVGLNDESQKIQATPQNTVILQSDTEPENEDESSEEDFEIETAEQTNNSIKVESQTCYSNDKNDNDSPVVGHSSKAVNYGRKLGKRTVKMEWLNSCTERFCRSCT